MLQRQDKAVFLVSGGFHAIIDPIAEHLGLPASHVFANTILYKVQCLLPSCNPVSGAGVAPELGCSGMGWLLACPAKAAGQPAPFIAHSLSCAERRSKYTVARELWFVFPRTVDAEGGWCRPDQTMLTSGWCFDSHAICCLGHDAQQAQPKP